MQRRARCIAFGKQWRGYPASYQTGAVAVSINLVHTLLCVFDACRTDALCSCSSGITREVHADKLQQPTDLLLLICAVLSNCCALSSGVTELLPLLATAKALPSGTGDDDDGRDSGTDIVICIALR